MAKETSVFYFYWGFGPVRWAFTNNAIQRDRVAVAKHSRQECLPMEAIGPIREMLLEELPPEPEFRLYVGA
jgi:hypothetical protein